MALLNFLLFCFVIYCYAFVQYCYLKSIQYNAMHKFAGVLDNPLIQDQIQCFTLYTRFFVNSLKTNETNEEQEVFTGFTIKEAGIMRQKREQRQEQEKLRVVGQEIDQLLDAEPQENKGNSVIERFASDDEETDEESSHNEDPVENGAALPPNPI